jgi:hypothetical protein
VLRPRLDHGSTAPADPAATDERKGETMARKRLTLLLAVVAAIVAAPAGARTASHDELTMTASNLVFGDATAACPGGTGTLDVSTTAGRGNATFCFLSQADVTPCPGDQCTVLSVSFVFSLPGGTIATTAEQDEVDVFDPTTGNFTVNLTWRGAVTQATQRFHKLGGEPFSGKGATVFGADGSITANLTFTIEED